MNKQILDNYILKKSSDQFIFTNSFLLNIDITII